MATGTMQVGAAVPSLVRWGLTPDADLIFRTLTTYGPASAGDLASALGMSRKRVDGALADLRSAQSVGWSRGVQQPWRAEPADTVVQNLRQQQMRRAVSHSRSTSDQVSAPAGTQAIELGPDIRHLPSREAARLRMSSLVRGARHETLTFNPEVVFDLSALRAAAPMDRILMARGVCIRIIGTLPPDPDRTVPHGGERSAARMAYREMPVVPMKLIVIDRQVAFFPVDPRDYEHGYLEIVQPPLVRSLVETFERCWAHAEDPQEKAMSNFALSPREEVLIGLLVHGHTDASAARALQISERSVTNILRSLMDRLGVDNRFQLGVALGALRAAPAPPGLSALNPPPSNSP